MKKIVLIDNEPFTKRREQLFYINRLIADGFSVQIWDASPFFPADNNLVDIIREDYIKRVYNTEELENLLTTIDIPSTFFIVESAWIDCSRPIYRILKKHKCFIARFDFYSNVIQFSSRKWGQRGVLRIVYHICKYLNNQLKTTIKKYKWYGIKFDVYLSPKKTEGVTGGINHPDYNDYKFKMEAPIIKKKYIVFCDQYFPLHPDILRFTSNVNAARYYSQMRVLFDYIEEETGLPIIIACHPKSNYSGQEFGDRTMIKYQTRNLVVNSEKVIFHTTNSLSYSVMANKEVLCVYTDDFKSYPAGYQLLSGIKKVLGIHTYNLDSVNLSDIYFEKYNKELRESYIYNYLTTKETENIDNYYTIKNIILNSVYNK